MAILLSTNKSAAASTVEAWRQALLAVDPGLDIRGPDAARTRPRSTWWSCGARRTWRRCVPIRT